MKTLIAPVIAVLFIACDTPVGPDKPNGGSGVVRDCSGNWYTTVKLGLLEWTVENLRATHYADGTPIPIEDDSFEWYWRGANPLCAYNGRLDDVEKYGCHYNWHVVDPENPKNIAPDGWRVPTNEDRDYLVKEYGLIIGAIAMDFAATTGWNPHTTGSVSTPGKNPTNSPLHMT